MDNSDNSISPLWAWKLRNVLDCIVGVGKMNPLKAYKLYSIIVSITVYITMVTIWASSTMQGLANGQYFVTVETDVIGENWIELAILLTALPGVLMVSLGYAMRLIHQSQKRPPLESEREARHQTAFESKSGN